jgi:hypothetical protein
MAEILEQILNAAPWLAGIAHDKRMNLLFGLIEALSCSAPIEEGPGVNASQSEC